MGISGIVQHIEDFPHELFYILVWDESIRIPGDERSRTHPGHGYPESTKHFVQMRVFTDQDELKAEIEALKFPKFGAPKPFRVLSARNVVVDTKVELLLQT